MFVSSFLSAVRRTTRRRSHFSRDILKTASLLFPVRRWFCLTRSSLGDCRTAYWRHSIGELNHVVLWLRTFGIWLWHWVWQVIQLSPCSGVLWEAYDCRVLQVLSALCVPRRFVTVFTTARSQVRSQSQISPLQAIASYWYVRCRQWPWPTEISGLTASYYHVSSPSWGHWNVFIQDEALNW